ncbi:hypothetical protein [Flavobacterium sp. I3-2]|uniref:hypothetical protein n=1 Tax=Flavobacterium sp. I3-2 TaxID=2748319 RepID=UPI0015A9DBBE|nr:hypothetical protein [Flavobacterium sp. I3-2]
MDTGTKKHNLLFQLGNYVKYKGEVVQINNELLAKHLLNQLDEPIEPIEICKKWLYRFGFKTMYKDWYIIHSKSVWVKININWENKKENNEPINWSFGCTKMNDYGCDIKYIHELQNGIAPINHLCLKITIDNEIEILGSKLFNLSPLQQQIEILKKQIELYHYEHGSYDESYKNQQIELLTTLESLELKKSEKK